MGKTEVTLRNLVCSISEGVLEGQFLTRGKLHFHRLLVVNGECDVPRTGNGDFLVRSLAHARIDGVIFVLGIHILVSWVSGRGV